MAEHVHSGTRKAVKTVVRKATAGRPAYVMNPEYLALLENFRLMDDDFMSKCLENAPECIELMLRIILGKKDLEVVKSQTEYPIKSFQWRGVRFDVFASFPTRILGPKSHYQCNALFTRFPCLRHEAVDFDERRQKTHFIDAVFLFGTNEVHFVQTHLDWARLPDENERPRDGQKGQQL